MTRATTRTQSVTTLVLAAAAALIASGCSGLDKSCKATNSWAQPSWTCAAPLPPPTPEPEPEPIAEPEPEPEPEEPKAVRSSEKIEISEKVQFETASHEIKPESFGLLDEVAQVLNDNPDITKVRIEGHTDSRGGRAYNKKLSQRRAASVRKYLVDKGIGKNRLVARGYGLSKPIADNGTEDGMYQNRRVEFTILEQGAE
jgi:OOP family OmpA-OmpF porin